MTDIDAGIIEQYADHLYRRAAARVTGYTIGGALLGALGGAVASGLVHLTSQPLIPSRLGYATLLVGAAALGFYGYRVGVQRAFGLRLQAQLALHQLQVERTILRPAAAVAAAAGQHVEAPAPPPPVAPAPVPVTAVPPPAAPPAPVPVTAVPPPVAPPAPAPVAVVPEPPLIAPVAPPAPPPVEPPAPELEPTPAPPRLVEPPPALPPLTPPVSAGR